MAYSNEDLAFVPAAKRKWTAWNFAALWISMSLCIPTYMLASSLIEGGMNGWQALVTVFLGNVIVLGPMLLNGHAGAEYGIPFPVLVRASFGIRGANIAAILRAIVACGWFGIQTWIGGQALYQMIHVWWSGVANLPPVFAPLGLATGPALCFLVFLALNMLIVYLGIESIRRLLVFKAIVLPVLALGLLAWAFTVAKGFGPMLSQPSKFQTHSEFWAFFFPGLTAMVSFWATLSLNIPDFTRYAKSQRDQVLGQTVALPLSMTAFAFIGVAVTSATIIAFGAPVWDPVVLAGKFESPLLVSLGMGAVLLSTLATNIAANIVSPANDFANLMPDKIDFRIGGYLTGLFGTLIMPWKLVESPTGYIFTWLIAYSSLLGPVGGIMIADYFLVRGKHLVVDELYTREGRYWYQGGFNLNALWALLLGVVPNLPGFLVTTKMISETAVPVWMSGLYHYAWFVGFAISFVVYALLSRSTSTAR